MTSFLYLPAHSNNVREAMLVPQQRYKPITPQTKFELDSAYWILFQVRNGDMKSGSWMFDFGTVSFVSVYSLSMLGTIDTKHAGRMLACSQKSNPEIGNEVVSIPLLAREQKTLYVYCKTINSTVKLTEISILTSQHYENTIRNTYLRYGAFFGFLALMFFATVLLSYFLKMKVYLFFALYILSAGIFVAYFSNFAAVRWFYNWPQQALLFEILLFVCFISYSYLIRFFLNPSCPGCFFMRAQKLWRYFTISNIIVMCVIAIACSNKTLFVVQDIFSTINLAIALGLLIAALKIPNVALRFFIVGTLVTAVGGLILQVSKLFITFEVDGLLMCLVIEILMVAYSFAFAYRESERKRQAELTSLLDALQAQEVVLKDTNLKLEQRVQTRTAQILEKTKILEEKNKELENLNSLKNKFISIIGHDLKNPIGTVSAFVDLLYQNFEHYDIEKNKRFIGQIKHSITHTYQLLNNLLIWARAQSHSIKYAPEPIYLIELVERTLGVLSDAANAKQIQIDVQVPEKQRVFVDVNMLETILRNLIGNAIKFSKPESTITVLASISQLIVIKVIDQGVGMESWQIDRLFKIDSNFSTPGTNSETGTGLGLLITHEFAQRMGGSVSVQSIPGKGSTFIVIVPGGLPS